MNKRFTHTLILAGLICCASSAYSQTVVTSSEDTICAGDVTTLTASGMDSFAWSPITYLNVDTGSVVLFSPPSTDSVQVVGWDTVTMASDTVWTTIVVNPLPVVNITPGDTAICSPDSILLTGTAGGTYQWYRNGSLVAGATTTTIYATTSGVYNMILTDANACLDSASSGTQVIIAGPPSINVITSQDSICERDSVTWTGSGAISYTWNPSTGFTSSAGPSITGAPLNGVNYYCIGFNGCVDSVLVQQTVYSVVMNVTQSSGGNAICIGEADTITISGNAVSFVWTFPTSTFYTTNNSIPVSPSDTITIMIVGYDTNGCSNTVYVTVNVDTCVFIAEGAFDPGDINAWFDQNEQIVLKLSAQMQGEYQVAVYDMQGKTVYASMITKTNNALLHRIQLENMPAGMYVLRVYSGDMHYAKKLFKR